VVGKLAEGKGAEGDDVVSVLVDEMNDPPLVVASMEGCDP
jgi:hypothetical protein